MSKKIIQDSNINTDSNMDSTQHQAYVHDLESQVEQLKSKVSDLENSWKRALADYQNLQKRYIEERQDLVAYANSTLILKILFVLDNLEMVSKHSDDQGLKLTIKSFKSILEEEGVSSINVKDKEFDPTTMDAIEVVEGEENKVIEVLQPGYMLKNKVLRPARVKVGSGNSAQDTAEEKE